MKTVAQLAHERAERARAEAAALDTRAAKEETRRPGNTATHELRREADHYLDRAANLLAEANRLQALEDQEAKRRRAAAARDARAAERRAADERWRKAYTEPPYPGGFAGAGLGRPR